MTLTKAKCPSCGGTLDINPSLERGICVYCGGEFLVREAVQKFKAEVDGLPTLKSMLFRANQQFSDRDFDNAKNLYEEILKVSPTCHEAWWGLFRYKIFQQIKNFYDDVNAIEGENFSEVRESLDRLCQAYYDAIDMECSYSKEFERAFEYAPENVKAEYEDEIEVIKKDRDARIDWLKEISSKKIAEEEEQNRKSRSQKSTIVVVSSICLLLGWLFLLQEWELGWVFILGGLGGLFYGFPKQGALVFGFILAIIGYAFKEALKDSKK